MIMAPCTWAVHLDRAGADRCRERRDALGIEQVRDQHGLGLHRQPSEDAPRRGRDDPVAGAVGEADQDAERRGAAGEGGMRLVVGLDAADFHERHRRSPLASQGCRRGRRPRNGTTDATLLGRVDHRADAVPIIVTSLKPARSNASLTSSASLPWHQTFISTFPPGRITLAAASVALVQFTSLKRSRDDITNSTESGTNNRSISSMDPLT
jgi:hypothetical protein